MVDVNDPLHLPEYLGAARTEALLASADVVIFESPEYAALWRSDAESLTEIVEDTPKEQFFTTPSSDRARQFLNQVLTH